MEVPLGFTIPGLPFKLSHTLRLPERGWHGEGPSQVCAG